jgi:hypothetical protein
MRSAFAALIGLMALWGRAAAAADQVIDVGGAKITIPDPPGFTLVTPEMTDLSGAIARLLPSTHAHYLAYIPQELARGALAGERQDYLKVLTVQDIVGVGDKSLSRGQFRKVEDYIGAQNARLLENLAAKEGAPAEGRDPDIASALEVGDYVPLPMHEVTAQSAAYLAFMRTSQAPAGALRGGKRMAAATTLLYARRKALLINVGALDSEVEWAESFSEDWAKAILAANK